jgi:hypothetical protein
MLCCMHQLDIDKAGTYGARGLAFVKANLERMTTQYERDMIPDWMRTHANLEEVWQVACQYYLHAQQLAAAAMAAPPTPRSSSSMSVASASSSASKSSTPEPSEAFQKLTQREKLKLSIQSRLVSVFITTLALWYQHKGEPILAESLIRFSAETDQQCVFTHTHAMYFELRFGSLLEALKHLKILGKICPYVDTSTNPCMTMLLRLPPWLRETPRFWKGFYMAYVGSGQAVKKATKVFNALAALIAR